MKRFALVLLLVGCSGGGGNSTPSHVVSVPQPTPTFTATPQPVPTSTLNPNVIFLTQLSPNNFIGVAHNQTLILPSTNYQPYASSFGVITSTGNVSSIQRHSNADGFLDAGKIPLPSLVINNSSQSISQKEKPLSTSQTFYVYNWNAAPPYGIGNTIPVKFTLGITSKYGNIWVDNSIGVSNLQSIANAYDNAYLSDAANFGPASYPSTAPAFSFTYPACDSYGKLIGKSQRFVQDSGNVNILLLNGNTVGNLIGGWFDQQSLEPQEVLNCTEDLYSNSNGGKFIVISLPINGYSITQYTAMFAFETERLINFVNHDILYNANSKDITEDLWIDEGLAMLAEDLAVGGYYDDTLSFSSLYLSETSFCSLTGFSCYNGTRWSALDPASFGGSYLFARYLYDHYNLKNLIATSLVGQANLESISGLPFKQLFSNFAAALATNGLSLNLQKSNTSISGKSYLFGGPTLNSTTSIPIGGINYSNVNGNINITDTLGNLQLSPMLK